MLVVSVFPIISNVSTDRFLGDGWPMAAAAALTGVATTTLWLICSYVSGRVWPAYVGLSVYPAAVMAEVGSNPAVATTHRQLVVLASVVPAMSAAWMIHRGRRSSDVDTEFRPWRVFAMLTGIVGAAIVAGSIALKFDATPALSRVVIGSGIVAVLLWCLSAARCVHVSAAASSCGAGMAMAFLAFGVSASERIVGVETSSRELASWTTVSARTAALLGFVLLLTIGVQSLHAARLVSHDRQRALRQMRDRIARTLEDQTRSTRERRHDLRSLVGGIADATATLTRYRQYLDADDRRDLEFALTAELTRLRHSLADSGQSGEFNLCAAIRPLVITERNRGTLISAEVVDVDVVGSSESIAALVQNLVTNVRCHAPGSAIRISTDVAGGIVRLAVEDDGPGLPDDVRRYVVSLFRDDMKAEAGSIPAQRQGDSQPCLAKPGHHGLGLTICARLAQEQGARLRLADTPVGTRIELLLHAASNTVDVAL